MTLKHLNPTQSITPPKFLPLLRDENAYYSNLNRAAKNAYDYADKLNNMFTYSGSVSRLKANTLDVIELYNLVKISDNETITTAKNTASDLDRFGIVVAEKDNEGCYTVCTFNPNFVYPSNIVSFEPSAIGEYLYVDTINYASNISNITTVKRAGAVVVGKVTGKHSIFFHGTAKIFDLGNASTLTLSYPTPVTVNVGELMPEQVPTINGATGAVTFSIEGPGNFVYGPSDVVFNTTTGRFSGYPTIDFGGGAASYPTSTDVTVRATDEAGAVADFTITFNVEQLVGLYLSYSNPVTLYANTAFEDITPTFGGLDGHDYHFSVSGSFSEDMLFDVSTGVISGQLTDEYQTLGPSQILTYTLTDEVTLDTASFAVTYTLQGPWQETFTYTPGTLIIGSQASFLPQLDIYYGSGLEFTEVSDNLTALGLYLNSSTGEISTQEEGVLDTGPGYPTSAEIEIEVVYNLYSAIAVFNIETKLPELFYYYEPNGFSTSQAVNQAAVISTLYGDEASNLHFWDVQSLLASHNMSISATGQLVSASVTGNDDVELVITTGRRAATTMISFPPGT